MMLITIKSMKATTEKTHLMKSHIPISTCYCLLSSFPQVGPWRRFGVSAFNDKFYHPIAISVIFFMYGHLHIEQQQPTPPQDHDPTSNVFYPHYGNNHGRYYSSANHKRVTTKMHPDITPWTLPKKFQNTSIEYRSIRDVEKLSYVLRTL